MLVNFWQSFVETYQSTYRRNGSEVSFFSNEVSNTPIYKPFLFQMYLYIWS